MNRAEDELRQRFIRAMLPEIKVEPIETGAVNPGFPDLLLVVPAANGLFPIELKVGELLEGKVNRVVIKYRAEQNAKHYDLRQRIPNVWTFIFVPEMHEYFLIRDYKGYWPVSELVEHSLWQGTDLKQLKKALILSVMKKRTK